jgi:hypothetical protein
MNKHLILALAILLLLVPGLIAQKPMKPWDQWNAKEAQKIMNDSNWAQTQKEYLAASTFIKGGGLDKSKPDVDFQIRFYSAKPIRQAIARTMLLQFKKSDPEREQMLQQFVAQTFPDDIIVAVTFNSSEERLNVPLQEAFIRMAFPLLQKDTYLETKSKKVYLTKYIPPSDNGLGAAFYFPRLDKGQPYVVPEIGDVRFYANLPGVGVILDKRFKIANFMYEGTLEF